MLILASDTSTKSLSVAICRDNEIIRSETGMTGTTHAQKHMPAIINMLEAAGLKFSDIDMFVCTTGPGSYTGIRIGVATTKAMAYAAKKGAVGISTLETLAFPHKGVNTLVCPMLDARNRRVFSGGYYTGEIAAGYYTGKIDAGYYSGEISGTHFSDKCVIEEENRTLDEFLALIVDFLQNGNQACDELIFCGDPMISDFDAGTGAKCKVSIKMSAPEAADAARIAYLKLCENKDTTTDPFLLRANYISPSQAERMKVKTCTIRFAAPQDIHEIYVLEKECFTIPWSFESLENDILNNKKATYLVAECSGKIVGYIGMWQIFEDAEITNLAVAKDYRKQGIGNSLIREICAAAKKKGAAKMMLEVRETNSAAINVYAKNDFKGISIRKKYYEDTGENAIIMLKNL
ncbi:MAG: ribosomal protein S18-alanine N-acetyltransferase [Saccharofermentanales bacterium]